ncbi:MAG: CoA transferase, partial [Chloroflexota bacterium]
MAPHNVYPCRGEDRWLAIACRTDAEFACLARAIGRPDLVTDPRFVDVVARKRCEDDLDAEIARWTSQQEHLEAQGLLQRHGVPAGAVLDMQEMVESPHFVARHLFEHVWNPEVGEVSHMRPPWQFSGTPTTLDRPAPRFAEHNDYVLRDLVGMSTDELAALDAANVISSEPRS